MNQMSNQSEVCQKRGESQSLLWGALFVVVFICAVVITALVYNEGQRSASFDEANRALIDLIAEQYQSGAAMACTRANAFNYLTEEGKLNQKYDELCAKFRDGQITASEFAVEKDSLEVLRLKTKLRYEEGKLQAKSIATNGQIALILQRM